jgi:hypothetical protein
MKIHRSNSAALAATVLAVLIAGAEAPGADLLRGDANLDGRVTLSDADFLVGQFIAGGFQGDCMGSGDADETGLVDLSDAVYILQWTFGQRPPPGNPLTGCLGPTVPRDPDRAYAMAWEGPAVVQAGQNRVEVFLRARTAEAIGGYSISYWINTMVVDVVGVDLEGTDLPPADQATLEPSEFFKWSLAPTLIPEVSLLTAGAVLARELPLERLTNAATAGPLDKAKLLRVVLRIWPQDESDVSASLGANEFSVGGTAHLPAERGEFKILEIIDAGDFLRIDVNGDGQRDISDPNGVLGCIFLGQGELPCLDAADADDSGEIDLTDGIYAFKFLFMGGPPPPAPWICGKDPTDDDDLTCLEDMCDP